MLGVAAVPCLQGKNSEFRRFSRFRKNQSRKHLQIQ